VRGLFPQSRRWWCEQYREPGLPDVGDGPVSSLAYPRWGVAPGVGSIHFESDRRVMAGDEVAEDSSRHRGTFDSQQHTAEDELVVLGRGALMEHHGISRRTLLKGGAALAGLTVLRVAGPTRAFGQPGEEVIPWLDQPPPGPFSPANVGNLLEWEALDSWLTPTDNFFYVNHYGQPDGLDEATWRVDLTGLVDRPQSLTLADLKARPRREVDFTLECSGNHGAPFFIGAVGNARWAGTPLAPLLAKAGVLEQGTEVIFWGADRGIGTIRDNVGIISGGQTGTVEPDATGGLDLTITEQFARSMSLDEALHPDNLLCYDMNGAPLPPANGFPVRLIAPGWYGVANVKWLTRIEVVDHRYAGRYMARDYVTIREEERDGETVWTFTTVSHDRLKSAPAKVTRRGDRYTIRGAAWGAPIAAVEVQIDDGPWMAAGLDDPLPPTTGPEGYAWRFWTFDWGTPAPGEHAITSRAFDVEGHLQPAPDDPVLASKRTFWESNGQITRRVIIP
jgi:DMSO/TMAO reductase YedYZ molybdopterin-dependent catalytic subunit